MVAFWVGFDVGKTFHWVCVLDEGGEVVLSRRIQANEEDVQRAYAEIAAFGDSDERKVGIDLVGGPAALLQAALLGHGERVFHLPGMAVNRARDAYRGETKSDSRDAYVIADQLRLRWRSLPEIWLRDEPTAELRTLVSYRRDLVGDQTRCISRLRALLTEAFPGLDAVLDFRKDRAFVLLSKVATPAAARRLGVSRLARWLRA